MNAQLDRVKLVGDTGELEGVVRNRGKNFMTIRVDSEKVVDVDLRSNLVYDANQAARDLVGWRLET
jgi:hypothetical protein